MTSQNNWKRFLIGAFLVIGLIIPSSSLAQDKRVGIQIAPLILEYTAKPGGELAGQLQLFNPLTTPQVVQLRTLDFVPADERGSLKFFGGVSEESASQWLFFQPTKLVLQPKEEYILSFVIQVPAKTQAGTHTAVIFAQTGGETGQELSGSRVEVAAGAIFLIDVVTDKPVGPQAWSGRIIEFSLKGLRPIFGLPVTWAKGDLLGVVRFKNTGLYQQQVVGKVKVRNFLGRETSLGEPVKQRVLPQAIVQFHFPWQPTLLLGKYNLEVAMRFGQGQQLLETKKLAVWTISPLGMVLTAGLAGGVMMVLFRKGRSKS